MFRALSAHLQEVTLYTCSIRYCHSLREFVVACPYTAFAVYGQATANSRREWQYHMLHVYDVSFWRRALKARNIYRNI